MFDIVWQFWTWSAGEIAIFLILGAIVSFVLLIFSCVFFEDSTTEMLRPGIFRYLALLSIAIGFGAFFLIAGHANNGRLDRLEQEATQQETQQGIAHAFEASGHEVTGVYINLVKPSDGITMRISNSCGEWEYELLDNYSESDLRVDPVSVQRIDQGDQADSREFCRPPHEEWLLLLD